MNPEEIEFETDNRNASEIALCEIQARCGYYQTPWEYPGQVTRDVKRACDERDRYREALVNLAEAMEKNWGRGEKAGYVFPTTLPMFVSDREECRVDDLIAHLLETKGQLEP